MKEHKKCILTSHKMYQKKAPCQCEDPVQWKVEYPCHNSSALSALSFAHSKKLCHYFQPTSVEIASTINLLKKGCHQHSLTLNHIIEEIEKFIDFSRQGWAFTSISLCMDGRIHLLCSIHSDGLLQRFVYHASRLTSCNDWENQIFFKSDWSNLIDAFIAHFQCCHW